MGDLLESNKDRFATKLEELNTNLIIIIIIINIKQKQICVGIFVFKLFFGIYFNYFAMEFANLRDRFFVANLRWEMDGGRESRGSRIKYYGRCRNWHRISALRYAWRALSASSAITIP